MKRSRNLLKEAERRCEVQGAVFSSFKIEGMITYLSTGGNDSVEKAREVMRER